MLLFGKMQSSQKHFHYILMNVLYVLDYQRKAIFQKAQPKNKILPRLTPGSWNEAHCLLHIDMPKISGVLILACISRGFTYL